MNRRQDYTPLVRRAGFRFAHKRAWLSKDHLLVVSPGFFDEQYTRLYWGDLQMMMIYALERPNRWMLIFEGLCAAAPVLAAVWVSRVSHYTRNPAMFLSVALFEIIYLLWRVTRFRWGCVVATKVSGARFPVSLRIAAARRAKAEIINRATGSQGLTDLMLEPDASHRISPRAKLAPRKPLLVLHAVVFGLGMLQLVWRLFGETPLRPFIGGGLGILYFLGLAVLYFVQRDFEFPFAVRVATVMSQTMELLWRTTAFGGIAAQLSTSLMGDIPTEDLAIGTVQILFGLYGFTALYLWTIERTASAPAIDNPLSFKLS